MNQETTQPVNKETAFQEWAAGKFKVTLTTIESFDFIQLQAEFEAISGLKISAPAFRVFLKEYCQRKDWTLIRSSRYEEIFYLKIDKS